MSQARFVLTRSERRGPPPPPPEPAGGCGCASGGKPTLRGKVARVAVNGVEIDSEAIAREMQNHPDGDPAESWRAAARALVVRQLLLEEARRIGLAPDPEQLDELRRETDEESQVRLLLEDAVEPATPSHEECLRVYEGMKDRFVTPTLFEASHILIEPSGEDPGAWAEAEAETRAIIALVGHDARAFAEAASARSACPTANQGGSLGQIRRGELAAPVQAAIEALEAGRTAAEPVRSRFGWHAVRLERRIAGRALPFEVVEGKVRDMLEARGWAIGAAQYVADLAGRAQIEGVELTPPDAGFSACASGGGC